MRADAALDYVVIWMIGVLNPERDDNIIVLAILWMPPISQCVCDAEFESDDSMAFMPLGDRTVRLDVQLTEVVNTGVCLSCAGSMDIIVLIGHA
jgi:hypothetical protein